MKRLSGMDAMLLYTETPNVHMHTVKVAIIDAAAFEGQFTFEVFCRALQRRMHLLDPLRYQLVDIPLSMHHPMWRENCPVDFDYHVRRLAVPCPGGRRDLNQVVGEIASTPLDRSRPLWELYYAEPLAGDRVAVIVKVHHALADGVASANLLGRLLDLQGQPQDERDLHPSDPSPTAAALLLAAGRDHLHHIAKLPGVIKDAVRGFSRVRRRSNERGDNPDLASIFAVPDTFLNHILAPGRTFATATLALTDVKHASKYLGVTLNDIILAMTAGALRDLSLHYDGRAGEPLVAAVPVSIDGSSARVTGNQLSGLLVSLPVHVADPMQRVRLISASTAIAKEHYRLLGPELPGRMMAYMPPPLASAVFRRQAYKRDPTRTMNVSVSNVPGPRSRGHIAGAPVSEIYSVGPLIAGCAVNITVWSYVEQINISVLADDITFGDTHEVTDAMSRAFVEIRRAAGLDAKLSMINNAMEPA